MTFRLPHISGRITFNVIESDYPLDKSSAQRLGEDLLQVEYPNELILDVGWYGVKGARASCTTSNAELLGSFRVFGVRKDVDREWDWDNLVLDLAARDYSELYAAIELADRYLGSLRD
jgi:hypothetical protein